MDRNELSARLYRLRLNLPNMLTDSVNDEEFWPWFEDAAESIEGAALSAHDSRYVGRQISRMLQHTGLAARA